MASLVAPKYGAIKKLNTKSGVKTSLRLSSDLHEWLKNRAKKNARSLNTEILIRLEALKINEETRAAGASLATEPAASEQ